MKKMILALAVFLSVQTFCSVFAVEVNKTINLHSGCAYLYNLDKRPMDMKVSNPNVLKSEAVTEIYSPESQRVLTTLEEGISYVSFKQGGKPYTIKFLVDDKQPVDASVVEIDMIKDTAKNK